MIYNIPAPKKEKRIQSESVSGYSYVPNIYLPASREMVNSLEVGKTISITITGEVKGLEARESESGGSKNEIRIEPRSIKMDPPGKISKAVKSKMLSMLSKKG
jgi:hypothetical protein